MHFHYVDLGAGADRRDELILDRVSGAQAVPVNGLRPGLRMPSIGWRVLPGERHTHQADVSGRQLPRLFFLLTPPRRCAPRGLRRTRGGQHP